MISDYAKNKYEPIRDSLEAGEWPDSEMVGELLDGYHAALEIISSLISPAVGRAHELFDKIEKPVSDRRTAERITASVEQAHEFLGNRREG